MKKVHLLTFHWGWISPACYTQLRHDQGAGYLAYLRTLPKDRFGHVAFNHSGWMFDLDMPPDVKRVPGQELEPTLHVLPFDADEVATWRDAVREERLEPVTYYYVPLVAEQITGEMLLRAIRYSRQVIEQQLETSPVSLTSHDPFTMMHWGTAQQVQLAALTGHTVLMGGLECIVIGMDGTRLPCIGAPVLRYGLESMAGPMIEQLEQDERDAFFFATEMHWHHRTNPFERALQQIEVRFGQVEFVPCTITAWMKHVREWPEVPAAGIGSKGWNAGGPDQMQLGRLVRMCELVLPGIEALDALRKDGGQKSRDIETLWKRTLMLADNHIRWFVHDHKRIYLPAARALLSDVQTTARDLAESMSTKLAGNYPRLVAWNLLGWERSAVATADVDLPAGYKGLLLRDGDGKRPPVQITPLESDPGGDLRRTRITWVSQDLPPWGYRAYDLLSSSISPEPGQPDTPSPLVLDNARLRATFAANGELVTLQDKKNNRVYRGGHRLLNLIAQPSDEEQEMAAGIPLSEQGGDTAGCFSATAEVVLPEVATYTLDLDEMAGCLILVEIDVIGRRGRRLAPTRRVPIISLHWMEPPHRSTHALGIPLGEIASGVRLRITLWFLSEGNSVIGRGAVRSQRNRLPINRWRVRWAYRLKPAVGQARTAEVLEQGPVRQRLRFRGQFPQCSYETTATLEGERDTPRIDFETTFIFAESTPLGIPTLPVPEEIGSYLGSNCERPYIPGLAVVFPVGSKSSMVVDAPYALRNPLRPVHPVIRNRSWLASATEPVQDFWWGLAPFTAVQFALIQGWGGLIADGFPHFFLWRNLEGFDEPLLGISFGASLIHPRTVTKRPQRDSEWFEFGRGPAYADFQDSNDSYEFNHPQGRYVYRYSLVLESDPLRLWKAARETAVAPIVVALPAGEMPGNPISLAHSLLKSDASNVVLTGCDWLGTTDDNTTVRVRLVELTGKATSVTLHSERPVQRAKPGGLPVVVTLMEPHRLTVEMPAYGVREILLELAS